MNKHMTNNQQKEATDILPDLKDVNEVRKAVIAAEILQRKW